MTNPLTIEMRQKNIPMNSKPNKPTILIPRTAGPAEGAVTKRPAPARQVQRAASTPTGGRTSKLESFPTGDIIHAIARGCSSVVERHVANVNVVGSNPITRFLTCLVMRCLNRVISDTYDV